MPTLTTGCYASSTTSTRDSSRPAKLWVIESETGRLRRNQRAELGGELDDAGGQPAFLLGFNFAQALQFAAVFID